MEPSPHPRFHAPATPRPSRSPGYNQARIEFPAISENVAFARTTVAVFASQLEFTLDELDDLKVAVSEAVSNCVLHAYPQEPGWVRIYLETDGQVLTVEVADDGIGIENVEAVREAGVTTRPDECMGLGFTFMAEYTDELEVESEVGVGTRVRMRKKPAASRAGDSEARREGGGAGSAGEEGAESGGNRADEGS